MPNRKSPPPRPYHHGDLRHAMLQAAGQLIEEQGLENFTLRECARRAGVSHGAPAHHFGDVRGLLTALVTESFEQLHAAMAAHEAAAAPDAYAQLVANGQAYVAYALAHRGRFQLMFRRDRVHHDDPALLQAGAATYSRLQRHIAAVLTEAGAGHGMQAPKALLAWTVVHGLSTLSLENGLLEHEGRMSADTVAELLETFMVMLRPGLEAAEPQPPPQRRSVRRAGAG
jgi:AcrR family transcriptional regulator